MKTHLKRKLGKFIVVYFDDILIYCKIEAGHYNHVHEVQNILLANKLYVDMKKCSFFIDRLLYM